MSDNCPSSDSESEPDQSGSTSDISSNRVLDSGGKAHAPVGKGPVEGCWKPEARGPAAEWS